MISSLFTYYQHRKINQIFNDYTSENEDFKSNINIKTNNYKDSDQERYARTLSNKLIKNKNNYYLKTDLYNFGNTGPTDYKWRNESEIIRNNYVTVANINHEQDTIKSDSHQEKCGQEKDCWFRLSGYNLSPTSYEDRFDKINFFDEVFQEGEFKFYDITSNEIVYTIENSRKNRELAFDTMLFNDGPVEKIESMEMRLKPTIDNNINGRITSILKMGDSRWSRYWKNEIKFEIELESTNKQFSQILKKFPKNYKENVEI